MKSNAIKGTTRITGLLGNPVKHSISPLIHNHAFAELGLDFTYLPLGCEKEKLGGVVESLRALNFAGVNVTIPYKSDVIPFCDEISQLSKLTGTVNTLYWDDEKLCGTTTDANGFLKALTMDGFDITDKKVLILGNGGTARTLAMVLAYNHQTGDRGNKTPLSSLTIAGRNPEKVRTLVNEIKEKTGFPIQQTLFSDEAFSEIVKESDLIVNCTPIGMHPYEDASPLTKEQLSPTTYVFDAIYNPGQTKLLQIAEEVGCNFQNGLRMLLGQGLDSFKLWTGHTVDPSIFNIDELQKIVSK